MTTITIILHYDNNPLCKCDDCGITTWFDLLKPITNIEDRIMAGSETPAGECSSCGALSYILLDEHAQCRKWKLRLAEMISD